MIRTEREYRITKQTIESLEAERAAELDRWRSQGVPEAKAKRLVSARDVRITELRDAVSLYERVQRNDLSMFRYPQDEGLVLIAARIARGWSQRKLAEKLDVVESQVSRDERNGYRGVTLERKETIADVLGLELEGRYVLGEIRTPAIVRPNLTPEAETDFKRAAVIPIKDRDKRRR